MSDCIVLLVVLSIPLQATRFPKDSFSSLKYLQGQTFDADAVSFYASISTAEIFEATRKTVGLRKTDDSEWSVEELIAMQFAYVKELAESVADDKVLDVVVTVS
jgi:hypoxia up-regulated 1